MNSQEEQTYEADPTLLSRGLGQSWPCPLVLVLGFLPCCLTGSPYLYYPKNLPLVIQAQVNAAYPASLPGGSRAGLGVLSVIG